MLVGGTNQKSLVKSTLDVGSASPMLVDGVRLTEPRTRYRAACMASCGLLIGLYRAQVPPTPGVRHRWGGKKALLDYDNNGCASRDDSCHRAGNSSMFRRRIISIQTWHRPLLRA